MKINIIYKEINGWFLGHVQEYPDYESQGRTLEELKEILMEIYDDIGKFDFSIHLSLGMIYLFYKIEKNMALS